MRVPYLFIIYLDYVLRTPIDLMKENGFTLERQEAKKFHALTTRLQLLMGSYLDHLTRTDDISMSLSMTDS